MHAGRLVVGRLYRAGPRGVRITWPDGSTTAYSAREQLYLPRMPQRVEGRLYPCQRLEYEAPALVPER